jgi:hypothetical protein
LPSPLGKRNAGGRELLNAVVVGICNVHVAMGIERHGRGTAELSGAPTEASEDMQPLAGRGDLLNLIVASIGDVDIPLSVDREATREPEAGSASGHCKHTPCIHAMREG